MTILTYNRTRILFQDGNTYTVDRGQFFPHKKEHSIKVDIHNKLWVVNSANKFCYHYA